MTFPHVTGQVTVVMMNYLRPLQVQFLIGKLVGYTCVDEVLIWHCHNETVFQASHPKVRSFVADPSGDILGGSTATLNCHLLETTLYPATLI